MTADQARFAAEVLRQRAPVHSHEGRHACHEAMKALEGYAHDLEQYKATRDRLLELSRDQTVHGFTVTKDGERVDPALVKQPGVVASSERTLADTYDPMDLDTLGRIES